MSTPMAVATPTAVLQRLRRLDRAVLADAAGQAGHHRRLRGRTLYFEAGYNDDVIARGETPDEAAVREAIRRHYEDSEYHDLTLIAQCLSQTLEERLAANEAFVEFLCSVRDEAPLVE